MSDCMTFPDTVEEFMEQYKIVDTEHVYTNGVEMVPIFRMKQWFEHKPERKKGKWIDAEWENINTGEKRKGRRCSVCGHGYFRYDVSVNTVSDIPNFCPNCGADMRGEQNENN